MIIAQFSSRLGFSLRRLLEFVTLSWLQIPYNVAFCNIRVITKCINEPVSEIELSEKITAVRSNLREISCRHGPLILRARTSRCSLTCR